MNLNVEPKDIIDAYSTPIVQQTSFWSKVKKSSGWTETRFWCTNKDKTSGFG